MADVYAFEESESLEKYEELKQRLGFTSWNIDVKGNKMCVLIDRIDIDDKFKDMAPGFKFGEFIKAGQIVDDHNCLQLHGTYDSVVLALGDFYSPTSTFGAGIDCTSVETFCNSLDEELESWKSRTRNVSTEKAGNVVLHGAGEKQVGIFKVPIHKLVPATKSNSIRNHSDRLVNKFVSQWKIDINNGRNILLPMAVGLVKNPQSPLSGEAIELIDGNHTLLAAKRLLEEMPDAECLKERDVVLYHNLTRKEVLTLALLKNQEAGNSNPTSELDKIILMRRELANHNGKLTAAALEHLYEIFNCLCPSNKKEENRRKKQLNPLARLATMDREVWSLIEDIEIIQGGTKMYKYRPLSLKSVSSSTELLKKVKNGTIKYSSIRTLAKELPDAATQEDCVLQRIRSPRMTGKTKDKKGSGRRDDKTSPLEESEIIVSGCLNGNAKEDEINELQKVREKLRETETQLEVATTKLKREESNVKSLKSVLHATQIQLDEALSEKTYLKEQIRSMKEKTEKKAVAKTFTSSFSNTDHGDINDGNNDNLVHASSVEDITIEDTTNLSFAVASPQTGNSNCSNVVISKDSDTQVDTGVKRKRTRNETFDIGDTVEALWVNKRPHFKKWYRAEITSEVKKGETYQVKFEEDGFKQVLDVTRIRK